MNVQMNVPQFRAVHVFFPLQFTGGGPTETCYRLCREWVRLGERISIHTSAALRDDPAAILTPAFPRMVPRKLTQRLVWRPSIRPFLWRRAERRGVSMVRAGDLCYFWPGVSTKTMREAKDRGATIVVEFINSHVAYARNILEVECARLAVGPPQHITDADIEHENERLALSDFAFCPGPLTSESIRSSFRRPPVLLEAAYGADAQDQIPRNEGASPLRFLFVGTPGIRKGVPVLLDAWRQAGLAAELWIVGAREPNIAPFFRQDDGVHWIDHTLDIKEAYRTADIFVFPSLEEGGPQVTYEAAAHGLPLLVTPMGGGRIASHGRNAVVVPPSDVAALRTGMTELYHDAELRRKLGSAAREDSKAFQWDRVAANRMLILRRALDSQARADNPGRRPCSHH